MLCYVTQDRTNTHRDLSIRVSSRGEYKLFYLTIVSKLLRHCHFWLAFGVYLLDLFCSGIQFYLLLSPYLCFISALYLDLYVLGDDALIS